MAHHHHHQHMQREKRNPDLQTIVSVVYVTASKTFSGAVGGYITLDGSQSSTSAAAQKGTPVQNSAAVSATPANTQVKGTPVQQAAASSSSTDDSSSAAGAPIRSQRPNFPSSSSSTTLATAVSSSAAVVGTPIALTTSLQSSIAATSNVADQHTTLVSSVIPAVAAVSTTAVASISATATPVAHANDGPSTGAKAGVAIGIILAFAVLAGFIAFFVRRKRSSKDDAQHLDDEKRSAARQSSTSVNSSRFSAAKSVLSLPHLSLVPSAATEKQERPALRHTDSLTNPFEDAKHEVMSDRQINNMVAIPIPAPLNFRGGDRPMSANVAPQPAPIPVTGRTSPSGPAPINVHRVQLDFRPSADMDDELEVRAGQIVRVLYEYDDGWALCKRLDGSQQGVVPRTCLSRLPLKRREGPPGPRPTNGRQPAPGQQRAPSGSFSSAHSYLSDEAVPRPLSPAGRSRAQSSASTGPVNQVQLNEEARQRANSAGAMARPAASPGLSPLNPSINRRPVPGSAM